MKGLIQMVKIAAVVVTFNRKQLLLECLQALINQTHKIDAIYIVDNASTDGTPELLIEKGFIGKEYQCSVESVKILNDITLYYKRLKENLGGAGGFYEGLRSAFEKGYDWYWIMDDDAIPEPDSLSKLVEHIYEKDVVALACKVVDSNGKISEMHRGFFNYRKLFPVLQDPLKIEEYQNDRIEIDFASFVGILVSRQAIEKIGFPRAEFFIHNDDLEYSLRLRKIGKILLISNSVINHKEAAKSQISKKFLWKRSDRKPIEATWISYYGPRNLIVILNENYRNKFILYMKILKNYFKQFISILVFDDYKFKRIKLLTKSYSDGVMKKLGKRVNQDFYK
jgi:rhamnopyranosyl-N-acetylglucosaminyl-diphospho-decaprenol beta-1,3/1,4-galactofuranosyltransferase